MVAATLLGALPLFAASDLPEVVAKVDGEPILRADVLRVFDTIVLASGSEPSNLSPEERKATTEQVVTELVNDRLLARASKDFVVTDAEVDRQFQDVKRGFADEAAFREEIIKSGQTESGIRENLRIALREEKWLAQQVAERVKVEPAEIEKTYKENIATFSTPDSVRVSHILIQILPGASPEVVAEKQRQLKSIADRIVKGEDFAALARQYSEDTATREAGGDLNYFTKESVDTAFGTAAFKHKVGDVISPVRSKIGLHIIKVTGRRAGEPVSIDLVRDRIIVIIQREKRRVALQNVLASLREKAKIEIFLEK